jgi:hypothetical protein
MITCRTLYASGSGISQNASIVMPDECLVGQVLWNVSYYPTVANDFLRVNLVTTPEANEIGNDRSGRLSQVLTNGGSIQSVNFSTPATYIRLDQGQSLWIYTNSSGLASYEVYCVVTLLPVDFLRKQDHVVPIQRLKIQAPPLGFGQGVGEDLKVLKTRGMSGNQAYEALTDTLTDLSNAIQTIYDFNYLWLTAFDLGVMQNTEVTTSEFIGLVNTWMGFGLQGLIQSFGPLGHASDVGYDAPGFANNKKQMQDTLTLTIYEYAVQNILARLWGQSNPRKYVVEKVRKRLL